MSITRLLVNRASFDQTRIEDVPVPVLSEGEVLAKVGRFALTANNITYAFAGDMIGYWQFFPVDPTWGIVPVWGFAEVIASNCADVPVGDCIWGFLPMASHVVMKPVRVRKGGWVDGAEHRQALPVIYNDYVRTNEDAPALAAIADQRSLLFPLLITSYLIADYLEDNQMFGAEQVIISSASSKTGFGTAHYVGQLAQRPARIIGLTSPRNMEFTKSLRLYDDVIAYDAIADLDPAVPTAYVDMSGDGDVQTALHTHFGDQTKASISVGATHWEAPRNRVPLPGAQPAMFFAPSQIVKRNADWGQGVLMGKAQAANVEFAKRLEAHVTVTRFSGADAVKQQYQAMVAGATPPMQGIISEF
jgi:Protein of unknown function (DUF2855)